MEHLLKIIAERSIRHPEKVAFTFYRQPPCTFSRLWREINLCAAGLLQLGLNPREPVIIAIPNSDHFFFAFYGVQRAGGMAVPVFPGSGVDRMFKLAGLCGASSIVISQTYPPAKIEELKKKSEVKGYRLIFVEKQAAETEPLEFPKIHLQDTAFIQFTSGSSGDPKGVQLSHANIITNLEQMIAGMAITTKDRFVSWLPVYHDMGLILMTMVPFYLGIDLLLLPTGLNYLEAWLETIQEQRGTFTAAPDFAYRLCLLVVREKNIDLSSLRVALNAAEPVRAGTIKKFEKRFGLKNVILPAYGLAEATVGVSGWQPGKKIKVDSRGFVSVGKPFPNIRMKIVRNNKTANFGDIGEIYIKSPANTAGYYKNSGATKKLFSKGGYIQTGDLGYCDEQGDYYITGRKKNIIIQGGFNIAAREVEELVEEFSFVRRSAALGIDRGGAEGEQVYIFIEINLKKSQLKKEDIWQDMTIDIVQRFEEVLGLRPGRVYWLKHGAIPMTYNGKIKYLQLKKLYREGTLKNSGMILFPHY